VGNNLTTQEEEKRSRGNKLPLWKTRTQQKPYDRTECKEEKTTMMGENM